MLKLWSVERQVTGQVLALVVPQLADHPLVTSVQDVLRLGVSQNARNVPIKTSVNGIFELLYIDIDCEAVRDEKGEVHLVLQTATDVTKRHLTHPVRFAKNNNLLDVQHATQSSDHNGYHSTNYRETQSIDQAGKAFLSGNAELQVEHDRVKRFFIQAPAGICVLDGPDMVFEMVNPLYQQFFPNRELVGKPLLEALPELENSLIWDVLQDVYHSGITFEGKELHVPLAHTEGGELKDRYFNFIYQARLSSEGNIDGILVFVIEVTEAVLNRRKQEANELSLRNLVLKSHYGLMILRGAEFVIEIANQQIANLWNKGLSDITGKCLLDVLPELADQPFPALLKRVYSTGSAYGQDEEVLFINSPEGQLQRYVSFYYDPMLDAEGNVDGIIVACEDITEKVNARNLLQQSYEEQQTLNEELTSSNEQLSTINEELAATNEELISINEELVETQLRLQQMVDEFELSENKTQAIVASAPFPIGVYEGREMRIVLANKSIMDVWGKGYDVVGKRYSEILPELENQEIFQQLDGVFTTGIPFHARNQRVDLMVDGSLKVFYFNYSFTPLFDAFGDVYGVMNTAADVTDLNLAKQKIEQNEQNLHNMILQAPVAMCILSGLKHIITVANPLMLEIWGKPVREVMYKPVFEALPDAREQGLEQVMADVYSSGKAFRANEMPVNLFRNGQFDTVYQNFVYEPYRDSNGNIVGIIAITINVTEQVLSRKKIEQNEAELLAIKKQLEAELEAGKVIQHQKDSFIGIASHELKTPLTSLSAIIQVAGAKLKNSDDAFMAGAMEKAYLQVKRMRSMISGFLNIARFESGNMLVEKDVFDIGELIQEVIEEVNITSNNHNILVEGCGSININADREKINSVLSNLISNAIKYSPQGKTVSIICEQQQEVLLISVEDQGIGIKFEHQAKVFDRYYRVEAEDTQHISGFGIGLYLSAEIVKRHGGNIWVESEPGKGSKFRFTLPLA